ncbi:MAG: hypothetical protein ACP5QD_08195, partial [Candidatus Ratteibacteria bacterium]
LWNRKIPFKKIVEESFSNAFGKDSKKVIDFLKKMSQLWKPFFEPVFIPQPDEKRIASGIKNIKKIEKICAEFRPFVDRKAKSTSGANQWSWKYLRYYLELLGLLLPAMLCYLYRSSECRKKFEELFEFLRKNEKILHPALDVSTYIKVLQWRVNEAEGIT